MHLNNVNRPPLPQGQLGRIKSATKQISFRIQFYKGKHCGQCEKCDADFPTSHNARALFLILKNKSEFCSNLYLFFAICIQELCINPTLYTFEHFESQALKKPHTKLKIWPICQIMAPSH